MLAVSIGKEAERLKPSLALILFDRRHTGPDADSHRDQIQKGKRL